MSKSWDFRFMKYFVKFFFFIIYKNRCILSKIFNGDIKSHQQIHFKRIFSSTKRNLPTAHTGIEIIDRQQEIPIIRLSNTCVDNCFVTPKTVGKRTTHNRMSTLWNSQKISHKFQATMCHNQMPNLRKSEIYRYILNNTFLYRQQ